MDTSFVYVGSEWSDPIRGLTVTLRPSDAAYVMNMRDPFISLPRPTAIQSLPTGPDMWKYRSSDFEGRLSAKVRLVPSPPSRTNVEAGTAAQRAVVRKPSRINMSFKQTPLQTGPFP